MSLSSPLPDDRPKKGAPEGPTLCVPAVETGAIDQACAWLRKGYPVALPTETVYGLAADALNSEAVARVFSAKARPSFDPLIVHLPDLLWLERIIENEISEVMNALMEAFWPGPLTLLFSRSGLIPDLVTAGLPRVAVRMSSHPVMQEVLRRLDRPLAAPSANRFGRISPVCASDVMEELSGRIPMVLDGGRTQRGLESTIVEVTGEKIRVLRAGPVTPAQLAEFGDVEMANQVSSQPVPGQIASHYAPRKSVRLCESLELLPPETWEHVALIGFRALPEGFEGHGEVLSATGSLEVAASNLFSALRRADASDTDGIVVEAVPEQGIGLAIMERLRRASGERIHE